MDLLRSLFGIGILLLIAFVFSNNRKKISLRTVGAALLLQVILGAVMLYIPAGKWLVNSIAAGVNKVISYSDAGSSFIFGGLVGPKMNVLFDGAGFVFAFHVLPAIIFITSLISILYYIGVMGWVINILGYVFQKMMRVSKVEAFAAVTTIFLGQNELPAALKPFISKMNRNELFTVICSGMASIAGSMLVGYAGLGVPIEYLLAASLMAIPGGILFARMLSPATEASQVEFSQMSFSDKRPASVIEAAASGAMLGLKIAVGVATVVMAFVALIALINGIVGGVGGLFGWSGVSLESLLGYIFSPLAYIMGVSWD
ncbi:NupC/NupG family nucleoside CNT transporter, partial [Hafnia paralvei]